MTKVSPSSNTMENIRQQNSFLYPVGKYSYFRIIQTNVPLNMCTLTFIAADRPYSETLDFLESRNI